MKKSNFKFLKFSYYEILYFTIITSLYLFNNFTQGLVYSYNNGNIEFVKNLHSSGGEDNIAFEIILFINIFFCAISLFNKTKGYIFSINLMFTTFSIFLIQMGEIITTIFKNLNLPLAIFIITYLISLILIFNKLRRKVIKYVNQ